MAYIMSVHAHARKTAAGTKSHLTWLSLRLLSGMMALTCSVCWCLQAFLCYMQASRSRWCGCSNDTVHLYIYLQKPEAENAGFSGFVHHWLFATQSLLLDYVLWTFVSLVDCTQLSYFMCTQEFFSLGVPEAVSSSPSLGARAGNTSLGNLTSVHRFWTPQIWCSKLLIPTVWESQQQDMAMEHCLWMWIAWTVI